jgi:hypothetical protein
VMGSAYKGANTTTINTGIKKENAVGVIPDCPTVLLHSRFAMAFEGVSAGIARWKCDMCGARMR